MTTIAQAVQPLKQKAIEHAAAFATRYVETMMAELEVAGWDANAYAPYPIASKVSSKAAYVQAVNKYKVVRTLTSAAPGGVSSFRPGSPEIRVRDEKAIAKFVEAAKEDAALQFEAFVAKLEGKVGEYDSAEMVAGEYVWNYSLLTVTKGNTVERWKTQQIVNISSLGNVFNQWPTRKVK